MKERPILFSAPMIRAILSGRKTQTRRVVKPVGNDEGFVMLDYGDGWWPYRSDDGESSFHTVRRGGKLYQDETPHACPYGNSGDRLWARETWARDSEDGEIFYRADIGSNAAADDFERNRMEGAPNYRWRPSIHMPRLASRINLEITGVRVERLKDISEKDAKAEGIKQAREPLTYLWNADYPDRGCGTTGDDSEPGPIAAYHHLWTSINGIGSWNSNPWVWVVEFKALENG